MKDYKPPDEVICKNSATANDHWDCDFKFIIHCHEFSLSHSYELEKGCNVYGYRSCHAEWQYNFLNTPKYSLDFVVELRNLARGRLDRNAQVERMCQLTAHRYCFVARSRTSHSYTANERVIASFLLPLCIHVCTATI